MFRLFKIFFLILIIPSITFADTTEVLRPIADGNEDSSFWETSSSFACDAVDCYEEVDEASGASCTNSDGDTSYVVNNASSVSQTFDINESSIPNGATVTQIDITTCFKRDTAAGGEFVSRYCIDSSCTNSSTLVTVLGTYEEVTQSISTNFVKGSISDIEIGLIDTDTKELRLSQISAVIIYTISTDDIAPSIVSDLQSSNPTHSTVNLSWTAPGDDGDSGTAYLYDIRYSEFPINEANFNSATEAVEEPTPSLSGSNETMTVGGLSERTTYYFALKTEDETSNVSEISNFVDGVTGVSPGTSKGVGPTSVKFLGQAYPNSTIEILRRSIADEIYRNIPTEEMIVNDDGTFLASYTGLLGSDYLFALRVIDTDGRDTGILSFNVDLLRGNLAAKDFVIPPTLSHGPDVIRKGSGIELEGYAAPNSTVVVELDNEITAETSSDSAGYWTNYLNTNLYSFGNHNIRTKQILNDGRESDFSKGHTIKISSLILPEADFNEDEKIDIADWSVFLFKWGSSDNNIRSILDFDKDGNINISDFSIFLESFIL